jgi:hypothetical protein
MPSGKASYLAGRNGPSLTRRRRRNPSTRDDIDMTLVTKIPVTTTLENAPLLP